MSLNGTIYSENTPVVLIENDIATVLDEKKAPLFFINKKGSPEYWLEKRAIDSHRTNSRLLKRLLRLEDKSDVEIVLSVNAVTLTDNYWFKSNDEVDLTWEQVKFKKNDFAMLALKGDPNDFSKNPERTPECTAQGSYEKCWKLENNQWWMYKAENQKEMFSELFIYYLGKALNFDMAEYQYEDGYIKTLDFTGGNKTNFEPAYSLVRDNEDYDLSFNTFNKISEGLAKQYLKLIYLDTICYNMDRHTYNYGVLRNTNTGEITSLAPNFDNNIALISRGYINNTARENDALMKFFFTFLENNEVALQLFNLLDIPPITEKLVNECFEMIPDVVKQDIDLQNVKDVVLNGYKKIKLTVNEKK